MTSRVRWPPRVWWPWPVLAVLVPLSAWAHGPAPIGVTIDEHADGRVEVLQRRPLDAAPLPLPMPQGCVADGPAHERIDAQIVVTSRPLRCDRALAGTSVVQPGLASGGADVMLRVTLRDGAVHRGIATATAPNLELPTSATSTSVFVRHVGLGMAHLLAGADHVMFALAIVLVARTLRAAVVGLSAFTVGHSLTLVAATLGWVRVPPAWAELGIAISIVVVALELARTRAPPPRLAIAAGLAGLLHGLGFATALESTGAHALLPALAGFNLGVELGQLAAVAVLAVVGMLLRRAGLRDTTAARVWIAHAIGAIAMAWCFDRALVLLGA